MMSFGDDMKAAEKADPLPSARAGEDDEFNDDGVGERGDGDEGF